jgi:Pyruvate/2-oxoacid:ferredoxin oxidoreductase gamma subunit
VERQLMMTGIGGQGVQLAARVVTLAALAEGRHVQLFGSYGGMMRGGDTSATVVVGDLPVESPPTIAATWSAVVMHHDYWDSTRRRLRPGSVVLVNSTVFEHEVDWSPYVLVEVPATELASGVGSVMAASLVMTGAYAAATGLVTLGGLVAAIGEALPEYRRQHRELNERAIRLGFDQVPTPLATAWPATVHMGPTGPTGREPAS